MNQQPITIPFGRHRGEPLDTVPTSYLDWLIRNTKLSSGIQAAVVDELRRRGLQAAAPPAYKAPACRDHPTASVSYHWQEDRIGRRSIRTECTVCRGFIAFAPKREPYTTMADTAASATPILDVLLRCEDLGIELASDGSTAWVRDEDVNRVPADLQVTLRQCAHMLGRMIGDNRETR